MRLRTSWRNSAGIPQTEQRSRRHQGQPSSTWNYRRPEAKQEVSIEAEAPKYPWGLCLTLNDDSLKKLGIDKLPEIGEKMKVIAVVEVSSVRAYKEQDGSDTSVDLHVRDLAIDNSGGVMVRVADSLYGK